MRRRHLSTPDSYILACIASLCLFVGTGGSHGSRASSSCREVTFERQSGYRYVGRSPVLESTTKNSSSRCALYCASSPPCQRANWHQTRHTCALFDRSSRGRGRSRSRRGRPDGTRRARGYVHVFDVRCRIRGFPSTTTTPPTTTRPRTTTPGNNREGPPVLPKRNCTLDNLSYRTESETRFLPVLQNIMGMTQQEDCALACYLSSVLCTGANYFPDTKQCELLSTYLEEYQQKNSSTVQGGSSHSEYPQPTEHGHSEGPQDYIFDIDCDGADNGERFLGPMIARFLNWLYRNHQTPHPPNNWVNTPRPPPWRPNPPAPRPNPPWRPNPPVPGPNPPWRPNPPVPRPISPWGPNPPVPRPTPPWRPNPPVPRPTPPWRPNPPVPRPTPPWRPNPPVPRPNNPSVQAQENCDHPAFRPSTTPSPYKVVLGSHTNLGVEPGEQTIQVAKVTMHESYNVPRHAYDVAVLKLVRPVMFSPTIKSICLAQQDVEPDTNCMATGWGATQGTGDANRLQQVMVPIMSFTQCNQEKYYNGRIHSSMMCAGIEGKDSCQGDSGGPLVCPAGGGRWRLQGVVSWGRGCGRAFAPGVYVKITQLRHWVISKMN